MHFPAKANALSVLTFMANKPLSDSDSDPQNQNTSDPNLAKHLITQPSLSLSPLPLYISLPLFKKRTVFFNGSRSALFIYRRMVV